MSNPKVQSFETKIWPVMAKILKICQDNKINTFGLYSLGIKEDTGEHLNRTAILPIDASDEEEAILLVRIAKAGLTPKNFEVFIQMLENQKVMN